MNSRSFEKSNKYQNKARGLKGLLGRHNLKMPPDVISDDVLFLDEGGLNRGKRNKKISLSFD